VFKAKEGVGDVTNKIISKLVSEFNDVDMGWSGFDLHDDSGLFRRLQ
jgi:hypothetical protein